MYRMVSMCNQHYQWKILTTLLTLTSQGWRWAWMSLRQLAVARVASQLWPCTCCLFYILCRCLQGLVLWLSPIKAVTPRLLSATLGMCVWPDSVSPLPILPLYPDRVPGYEVTCVLNWAITSLTCRPSLSTVSIAYNFAYQIWSEKLELRKTSGNKATQEISDQYSSELVGIYSGVHKHQFQLLPRNNIKFSLQPAL